ncbi:unnamed protein product [Vitrella brassicaformis CCMP3155]|uniref:Uncharacterized protein n=1 Tax=Vitrella brassicaformis (strain CCMP3155) TaxID=1169540 RepID=A0A0G4ETR3_VITBC|nr:unnamed protein product [Vitrella brassicaformis CCMP3155]|eukprot:CEM01711.1 unnamed protein product [Vitrella brassicaformis CCMP3155]
MTLPGFGLKLTSMLVQLFLYDLADLKPSVEVMGDVEEDEMIEPPAWVDTNVKKFMGHVSGDFVRNPDTVSRRMSSTMKGPDAEETYKRTTHVGTVGMWMYQNLCNEKSCNTCPLGVAIPSFYRLDDRRSVADLDGAEDGNGETMESEVWSRPTSLGIA